MSDEPKKGRWEKVKRSVSNSVSQAKAKWQEIKAEMQNDSKKPSKQHYGYTEDPQTAQDLKPQDLSQKKCPICQTPLAPELFPQFTEKGFIICEICGTEIN